MSLLLGSKIAEGGCSEVYEIQDGNKIVKLAKANTDYEAMRREYQNNLAAWQIGLPVARPFEMVEINGRTGIIFERIYGQSILERFMGQVMIGNGQTDIAGDDIRTTARMLYEIHSRTDVHLPQTQKEYMKSSIHHVGHLTSVEKEKVIAILDRLPVKNTLCHGDPNPGNILIQSDGKPVVIDWMDATIGNPEADLAEYVIMMRYAVLPSTLPKQATDFFDDIREVAIQIFIDEYTRLSGVAYDEVVPWIIPVAARKLIADAIPEEEKKILVQLIRENLMSMYSDE